MNNHRFLLNAKSFLNFSDIHYQVSFPESGQFMISVCFPFIRMPDCPSPEHISLIANNRHILQCHHTHIIYINHMYHTNIQYVKLQRPQCQRVLNNLTSSLTFRIFGTAVESVIGIILSVSYSHQGIAFWTINRHSKSHNNQQIDDFTLPFQYSIQDK